MNLTLAERTFVDITVEYTALLTLTDGFFIRIGSPFTLSTADTVTSLTPEQDSIERFSPLLALIGDSIRRAQVADGGMLKVHFSSGARIDVRPDPPYEAWVVAGPDGYLVVCLPSGKLAVWSGD
ncbi:DUF6188 family protein [Mycobacterium sp. MYCO198283]|uniref:DUF6188 family protein n=1 Tax=Mycobacterium sp. MYCO198283 TaxID=2883505 RepID=UPI001E53F61E|nr:DUF6188 family protein [Mycobacterium sp. MYCO198283]MCG5433831.1 DUF6188 family protein [Mycobacterium sp. MYCO198283]